MSPNISSFPLPAQEGMGVLWGSHGHVWPPKTPQGDDTEKVRPHPAFAVRIIYKDGQIQF